MDSSEAENVTYRSWSWSTARRSVSYTVLSGVLISLPLGFLLLLAFREGRRYQIWRPLRPVRGELRKDYLTRAGRRVTWRRLLTSVPGQALALQILLFPVWLLVVILTVAALPPGALPVP